MIILGTKFAFYLFWLLCLPVYLNTDFILGVWLKVVPPFAALFVQLGIIYTLCQNLSQCLYTTMLATGRIKKYQIIVGGLSLMAFPVAWIFFEVGLPSEFGYWAMIIFSVVCLGARLFLLQEIVPEFSGLYFVKKVICPIAITVSIVSCLSYVEHCFVTDINWKSFIIETMICTIINILIIVFVGLTKAERGQVIKLVKSKNKK